MIDQLALCRRRPQLDLGRMLFTFDWMSLWRDAGFAGFKHYAMERLGLSSSSLHRMISRERGFLSHPLVYEAVREGRLTRCATCTTRDICTGHDEGPPRARREHPLAGGHSGRSGLPGVSG